MREGEKMEGCAWTGVKINLRSGCESWSGNATVRAKPKQSYRRLWPDSIFVCRLISASSLGLYYTIRALLLKDEENRGTQRKGVATSAISL